jgi:GNAT superfamily N-acetyltransferase
MGGDGARRGLLRILLVHPDGRGLGLGAWLVDTVIEFARGQGYRRLQLWTNHPLAAARHIYLSRGFELIRGAAPQLRRRPGGPELRS